MEKIELNRRKRFYLLGIGGISMSALAMVLKDKGNLVGGSDITESDATKMLERAGVVVDFELAEEKIVRADYVICSSAIRNDNIYLQKAQKLGKKIFTRGQLLGAIAAQYDKVIAVAGSHGKTTTTALIYEVLKSAGRNPTLHLGGYRCDDGKNLHIGGREIFVTEACEYYDNFLNLHPYIAVVTNLEAEHMDYFKTFNRQKRSFEQFKSQSKYVIDDSGGFSAKNIRHKRNGELSFSLYENGQKLFRLHLQICEEVNTQNCIYAFRVCRLLGISDEEIKVGLENFKGVKTRFERVSCGRFDNVLCDYSHHPTEIDNAISSARKIFKKKRLVVVFQPHTFSRTRDFLERFVEVLAKVDEPILFRTYSAREKECDGVSAKGLADALIEKNPNTKYADNFEELMKCLDGFDRGDVLMFVGAGDLPAILHKNKFLS